MNYTQIRKLFSIIFPPSEDELRLRAVTQEDLLALMVYHQHEDVCYALPYHNPKVRSAIHLLKFYNQTRARKLLGAVLATHLAQHHIVHDDQIIIPIPLSSRRYHKRGYNQVSEVIKEACDHKSLGTLQENILIRTRHTRPQTSLSRKERLENMTSAFAVRSNSKGKQYIANRDIILIDDVTTTGATLAAAKAALLPLSPSSITCIALAH